MKQFTYSFTTTVEFSKPVTEHSFILRCLPSSRDNQEVWAEVKLDPAVPATLQRDNFGNNLVIGYIAQKHDHFSYTSAGTVIMGGEKGQLPNTVASVDPGALHSALVPGTFKAQLDANNSAPHPIFRFPSPLAKANDDMRAFACEVGVAKGTAPLEDPAALQTGCAELMHAIHQKFVYEPGSTTVTTTAAQAFDLGCGVCQDFTHVMIALLREWGLPTRYVSGITAGHGTTHAWAQAYFDGAWHGFDPTRDQETGDDYLTCAIGRDWQDCPVERGTFHTTEERAEQTQTIFMHMEEQ